MRGLITQKRNPQHHKGSLSNICIEIINLDRRGLPFAEKELKEAILYILHIFKIKKAQIDLCFVDNKLMRKLNYAYLKKNCPTDVLAFDLSNFPDDLTAEVFVSQAVAKKQARLYNNSLKAEVLLYVIHGILHLLGFKHYSKKDKTVMLKRQKKIFDAISSRFFFHKKLKINDYGIK